MVSLVGLNPSGNPERLMKALEEGSHMVSSICPEERFREDSEGMQRRVDPCHLLVVAAFAPELAGFEGLLGAAMQREVLGLAVVAEPVGVGLVASASGTASNLERFGPRAVVLVGTCGAYPGSGLSIGDLVVAGASLLVEPAVHEGRAALPAAMNARLDSHPVILEALAILGARAVDVGTTLAVTTDDDLAEALGKVAAVEHLEAFAVATACAAKGVPFSAVLGVANSVGSSGRAEWRANHLTVGHAASSHVARWIQAGAPGVPRTETA